jgi:hypothetical protein
MNLSLRAPPRPPLREGKLSPLRGRGSEATPAYPNRGGRSNLGFLTAKFEIAPARPVGLPGRASLPLVARNDTFLFFSNLQEELMKDPQPDGQGDQ